MTGGCGFFGRRIVAEFGGAGWHVAAPRRSEYDLTDPAAAARMLHNHPADLVVHAAATVGGIEANRREPGRFFYDNIVMGVHLIEAARLTGIQKIVTLGTVCSYPRDTPVPFRESDIWAGFPEETNAPYGIAKKALLVMGQAYRRQYGLNSIHLLPVNLFGEGDDFDPVSSHVIPAMIRKLIGAKERGEPKVVMWGTGGASREFLYVGDAARAVRLAAERYDSPEPVNIGAGFEITICDLAALVARIVGYGGVVEWDPSKPDGQPRRRLDVSRAEAFGFRAEISLEEGLRRTVAWWLENRPAP